MTRRTNMNFRSSPRVTLIGALLTCAVSCANAEEQTKSGGLEPIAEAGVTEGAEGDRYALVVGIDEFEDPDFDDLQYAVDDADAVADHLSSFDQVIRRTSPEETERGDLLEALEQLRSLAQDPRDVVFVYFSTHGTLDRKPGGELERYLVAHDTKLDLASSTGIAVEKLLATLESFESDRTALVLAACHSGSGKSTLSDELTETLAQRKSSGAPPALRTVSEATIMLSAAAFEEPARESPSLEHDVYTYFFLEAFDRGDRDGNGAVTVSEAHDYARRRTYGFTDGAQRPTSRSDILGRDPIVLAGTPDSAGKPILYSYQRSAEDLQVAVDGTDKGTLPGGIALDAGRHEIALERPGSDKVLWRGTVELDEGERLEVAELVPPPSTFEAHLEGGAVTPLSPAVRSDRFPVSGRAGIRAALLHEPWAGVRWEVRGSTFRSRGSAAAYGDTVPYRLRGGHLQIGGGPVWTVGSGFRVDVGADAGLLWASRTFDAAAYDHRESLHAPTLAGFGQLTSRHFDPLRVSVRADVGLLHGPLGPTNGLHSWASLDLGVGIAF